MANQENLAVNSANFSRAFQQMCGVFAIAKTHNANETIRELVLQCIVLLPDERFYAAEELSRAIYALFGLQTPVHEVEAAIDVLVDEKRLIKYPGACLTLPNEGRAQLLERISDAQNLENKIKDEWLAEIDIKYPSLPQKDIWEALKRYLAGAFRRHGIQAVALLNSSLNDCNGYSKSLTTILSEITQRFSPEYQVQARSAISQFMANTGYSADRTRYIAQLADGAFNYFSLATAPDIADEFRKNLSPLTIFLDTNFLFGILGISVGPQVSVSNELVTAINKYNFPFSLKFHERTQRELISSIDGYRNRINAQKLSASLGRAALTSPYLSGVEHKFYEQYVNEGIDSDSFFRRFSHVEELLHIHKITPFTSTKNRLKERAALFHSYQNFLLFKEKNKQYELIDHDATVLDEVRQLRSTSISSLNANALLVTCDYQLYLYDWEYSKKGSSMPCVVLPNLLWQLLRPFVPADQDFDRSFAETFAIPEFRIVGSGASEACSKALSILNSYKDFPEETASRLLSNDVFIERLRETKDDNEFRQVVESAVIEENQTLLDERIVIAGELEQERAHKAALLLEVKTEKERQEEIANQAAIDVTLAQQKAQEAINEERRKTQAAYIETEQERLNRINAEQRAKDAELRATNAELEAQREKSRTKLIYKALAFLVISIVSVLGFEWMIFNLPWQWLINHKNVLALRICINAGFISFYAGLFFPSIRGWAWKTIILEIFILAISLLA